jgi:hypothetical protein
MTVMFSKPKGNAKTIALMIRLYCKDKHYSGRELCTDCKSLLDYAQNRIQKCLWGQNKPTCARCTIHCYSQPMQEKVLGVMRYSGPKMAVRHPVLALIHILKSKSWRKVFSLNHGGSTTTKIRSRQQVMKAAQHSCDVVPRR